jgi:hypothetical protein
VNGDGKPDIVTANLSSNDISVLLGNGDGTFASEKHFQVGVSPRELAIRDVNGDGKPDLLVINNGSDFESVLLNTGGGNFAPQLPAFTAENNEHAVSFDYNKDGREDLVASLGDGRALIITGRGDGTFETRTELTLTNATIKKVLVADLDANQIPELLVLNQRSNTLDVLQYSAAITNYVPLESLALDGQVQSFVVQDLNQDGKLDLAVVSGGPPVSSGTNQLTLFFGTGGFGFGPAVRIPLTVYPNDLLAGDINGDGHPDLLVMSFATGSVLELTGDGTGAFQSGSPVKLADFLSLGALTNLDTDPGAELVVAGIMSNNYFLKVLKSGGAGAWTEKQTLSTNLNVLDFALQDITTDGRADVIALSQDEAFNTTVDLFAGATNGFGPRQVLVSGVNSASNLTLGDFDRDGRTDFLTGSTIYLTKLNGGVSSPLPVWIGEAGVRIVQDLNGDHKPDLLTWGQFNGTIATLFAR